MANRPAVLEISALAALKLTDALLSPPYYDGKLDFADRSRASGDEGKEKGGRCWERVEQHLLSSSTASHEHVFRAGPSQGCTHTNTSGHRRIPTGALRPGLLGEPPLDVALFFALSLSLSLCAFLSQAFTCISLTPFPSPFRFQSSLIF